MHHAIRIVFNLVFLTSVLLVCAFSLFSRQVEEITDATEYEYPTEWDRNFQDDLDKVLNHPNISLKWEDVETELLHIKIKKGRLYAAFPESMEAEHHPTLFMLQRVLCLY